MELTFPEQPINGVAWGICSLCFAIAIFIFSKKSESEYTDIVGGLFNKNGDVVEFEIFFKKNNNGSIYFKVTQGYRIYSVFPSLVRGNHSATVTRDDGAIIEYDCVKAE